MKRCILLILLVVILVGCGPGNIDGVGVGNVSFKYLGRMDGYTAHRMIDYEAQVVCYRFYNGSSCLPLSDTALPRE